MLKMQRSGDDLGGGQIFIDGYQTKRKAFTLAL